MFLQTALGYWLKHSDSLLEPISAGLTNWLSAQTLRPPPLQHLLSPQLPTCLLPFGDQLLRPSLQGNDLEDRSTEGSEVGLDNKGGSDGDHEGDGYSGNGGNHLFESKEDLECEIHQMRADFKARKGAIVNCHAQSRHITPSLLTSKKTLMVILDNSNTKGSESKEYYKGIIKVHARVTLILLLDLKQAHGAAHMVPLYNKEGEPIQFKPSILSIPTIPAIPTISSTLHVMLSILTTQSERQQLCDILSLS
ncbi:hypothetical protein FRC07_004823 [Ceratobasidium sp. 392]|nr:hypothetical protein FRC07_004823 [Ceratobasidium sp. 392]